VSLSCGAVGSLAGVNERHRRLTIETKVKSSSLRFHYHNFFRAIPDLVFVVDAAGVILDCNQLAASSLGMTRESIVGSSFFSLVSSASLDATERALARGDRKQGVQELEVTLIRKNGSASLAGVAAHSELPTLLRITSIPETRKGKDTFILILKDLTEQRRTQLQLIRFANAIHFTVNPIEITDISGKIIYVNPALERISGYRKEELLGRNPSILSSGLHDKSFWKRAWETILAGKVWTGEVVNKRKNGKLFYAELLISPIIGPEGEVIGFLGSHRDITERKHLEEQLVRSQKMESIGTLAAGIAHEVGNPLTSISSIVQVIQRTTTDQFAREKLELVKDQISRISRIIRDLVDFSRPSNYELQATSVNKILQDAVNMVAYGNKGKNIAFTLQLEQTIPPLRIIPDQLAQVFLNILLNAADAIDGEEGQITVRTTASDEKVYIIFRDTGRGIPEENLGKIFEPFFTTKGVGEGTGLGLWVSYGIIKNFNGDIKVASVVGKGTTFTVILPLRAKRSH
jgi:two-component system cell cycle sensor histidine kinase/response regulator CckA